MTRTPARRFPWLVLAYLGPLAVVPLLVTLWPGRRSGGDPPPETIAERTAVQWHAWQGFLLAVIETLAFAAVTVLTAYIALASVTAGVVVGVLSWVLWAAVLLLHFAAIVAALAERRLEVPGLAPLASRLTGASPS